MSPSDEGIYSIYLLFADNFEVPSSYGLLYSKLVLLCEIAIFVLFLQAFKNHINETVANMQVNT